MSSRLPILGTSILVLILAVCMSGLCYDAWKSMRISEMRNEVGEALHSTDLRAWLDLQIESARRKVAQLDPGPPPPWFYPSYYWDWLPRAKLYGEAQDALIALQKQKRELIEHGKDRVAQVGKAWNFGIAPILHVLLALTLGMMSLRLALRIALVQRRFGWSRL